MESSETNNNVEAPGSDPGAMLRQARERMDISQREMADRLNWLPYYVDALEENRFDGLRGTVFVRGYLRAYAKQVGIDGAELMQAYERLQSNRGEPVAVPQRVESRVPQAQKKSLALPVGIVIVLFLLLALWLMRSDTKPALAEQPAIEGAAELAAQSAAIEPDQTEQVAAADTSAQTAEKSASVEAQGDTTVEVLAGQESLSNERPLISEASSSEWVDETLAVQDEDGAEPFVSQPSRVLQAGAAQGDLLEFSFSGECWLEVRDAQDKLIYADLRQAGDTLELRGEAPLNVLVGDSRSVELRYKGEDFEIKPRPGRVVARVTVGDV